MSLAEHFQITVPYKEEGATKAEDTWTSFQSQRFVDCNPQPEIENKFNRIAGTDINAQFSPNGNCSRADSFTSGYGGNLDESGQRLFSDPKFFTQGYKRLEMKATDDQFSGEHVDLYYGEAVDERGLAGFVERNNMLDRA